jgi:hypothetical protein
VSPPFTRQVIYADGQSLVSVFVYPLSSVLCSCETLDSVPRNLTRTPRMRRRTRRGFRTLPSGNDFGARWSFVFRSFCLPFLRLGFLDTCFAMDYNVHTLYTLSGYAISTLCSKLLSNASRLRHDRDGSAIEYEQDNNTLQRGRAVQKMPGLCLCV